MTFARIERSIVPSKQNVSAARSRARAEATPLCVYYSVGENIRSEVYVAWRICFAAHCIVDAKFRCFAAAAVAASSAFGFIIRGMKSILCCTFVRAKLI